MRKKFVVTLHSWGVKKNLFAPRATRIIAISKGMQEEAIIRHGYNNADIDIVLHGVSPRFARPISDKERIISKSRYDIPDGKIIIGIFGNIQPRKGHHYWLEAVSSMPDRQKNCTFGILWQSDNPRRTENRHGLTTRLTNIR